MFEMRTVVPNRTYCGHGILQFRFISPCVDASGALCPGKEWSEWTPVPTVGLSEDEWSAALNKLMFAKVEG